MSLLSKERIYLCGNLFLHCAQLVLISNHECTLYTLHLIALGFSEYTYSTLSGALAEFNGGEGGIRTHGALRHNSFQDCRHRPLGHLSTELCSNDVFLPSGYLPKVWQDCRYVLFGAPFLIRRYYIRIQYFCYSLGLSI